MRIGEAARLKWTDINKQSNTIILNLPEKGSNPRICKVSPKLLDMIEALPKKNERIFGPARVRDRQHVFQCLRTKLARKLGNPRLTQITFHTFRHWKGTMEYHKTKDIMHVKSVLGHKNIQSTMIYINLEQAVFATENDEFNVKVAGNLEEACKLLEVGFEYVTDMDGKKLFRKRK
jgi:integrase